MSINGINDNDSFLKRRISNSLDRNNCYSLFPYEQARIRTTEYDDKDYSKPRIRKMREINDMQNNNDYRFRNKSNDFSSQKRTYLSNNINTNKPRIIIPRIVRKKKNINQYINKNTPLEKEEQFNKYNQLNNSMNNYKRPKSIEKYNYKYSSNETFNNNMTNNYNMSQKDFENQKKYKKINRNSSFDSKMFMNQNITNLLCKNCFDRKMLEEKNQNKKEIDKKEYLNNQFMNVNPFYFIDRMNDKEKKRIKDKVDSNSYKQRLALENYKKEIDDPKNNSKENLQLINEYSLNPLSIEVGKDPRYVKQKQNYDKKEKIIQQNPDKYKLGLRKAYNDYYNKCMYQKPKLDELYHVNSIYKDNYIKALKKQIEDKKRKEYEDKKKQKTAEALANKEFNEYKRKANLNDKEKKNNGIDLFNNDNKRLDDFKSYKNLLLKEKEKNLQNERMKKDNKVDNDINLRNKNDKNNVIENYHNYLDDIDKKNQAKKEIKDEENKKWDNYNKNYNLISSHCTYANCDICNRLYQKEKLKVFPPSSSQKIDFDKN